MLHHLVHINLGIVRYKPLIILHMFISFLKIIANCKECILKTKCFLWSVLAVLHPVERNASRVNKYVEFENNVNMNGIKYPVKVKDICNFEKTKPIGRPCKRQGVF